jgi:hypothetical protein
MKHRQIRSVLLTCQSFAVCANFSQPIMPRRPLFPLLCVLFVTLRPLRFPFGCGSAAPCFIRGSLQWRQIPWPQIDGVN